MQAAVRSNHELDELIKAKRATLRALDKAIEERRQYHRNQELLIHETIETGNTELLALNHDILLAKHELKDLKTNLRTCRQDKLLMEEDLEVLRVQISRFEGPGFSMGVVQVN